MAEWLLPVPRLESRNPKMEIPMLATEPETSRQAITNNVAETAPTQRIPTRRTRIAMNLEKINFLNPTSFDELIASAPDEIPDDPAKIATEALAKRQGVALGELTGWGERYLQAVKVPPVGGPWLAAYAIAEERIMQDGIVVLYGSRGGGKTRMAAELAVMVGNSRYRTAMRIFVDIRATFRKSSERSESDILDGLIRTDLLVIDEIQERGETAFEDRLLTHLIDARYSEMKPTILIANLQKKDLAASLGKSIVDRARENGKSIEFDWPSYRATP